MSLPRLRAIPPYANSRRSEKLVEDAEERAREVGDWIFHEIKNNEGARIEAADRAIARLRNDTVFARFGVAKIYENAGGERSRKPRRELRQSRAFG